MTNVNETTVVDDHYSISPLDVAEMWTEGLIMSRTGNDYRTCTKNSVCIPHCHQAGDVSNFRCYACCTPRYGTASSVKKVVKLVKRMHQRGEKTDACEMAAILETRPSWKIVGKTYCRKEIVDL